MPYDQGDGRNQHRPKVKFPTLHGVLYFVGQSNFSKNAVSQVQISAGAYISRMRDIDCDDAADFRWSGGHDYDAIGELNGLFDVMSDEQNRFALRFPNT